MPDGELAGPGGETLMLLVPIVGNPVSQVKAPALLNPRFAAAGIPLKVVPLELPILGFDVAFAELLRRPDVAGVIVTIPFKVNAAAHCDVIDAAAEIAGATNLLVHGDRSGWRGSMTDGLGLVRALRDAAFDPAGRRGFIAGAGGAGSSIASALIAAGIGRLDIFDPAHDKAIQLARRTGARSLSEPPDTLAGYDLLINATALGLDESDPPPFDLTTARADAFVADVIAEPSPSRLQHHAAARGLRNVGGMEMLTGQLDLLFAALADSAIHTRERA
jgi:shikimate dehydrogenase